MAERYWDKLARYKKAQGKKGVSQSKLEKMRVALPGPPGATMDVARQHYTGAGPDGVVQPDMPAMVDYSTNPPTYLHEDETVQEMTDGSKRVIPSSRTTGSMANTLSPSTVEEQYSMKRRQEATGAPSYEEGTGTKTYGVTTVRPGRDRMLGVPDGSQVSTLPPASPVAAPAPVAQTNTSTPSIMARPTAAPVAVPQVAPATLGPAPAAVARPEPAAPAVPTTPPSQYAGATTEAMGNITDVMRGESDVSNKIRDQEIQSLQGDQAALRARKYQELQAAGLSPDQISTQMSMFERSQDVTRGQTAATLGIDAATRAEAAAKDLATLGIQGQNLEVSQQTLAFSKQKYGDEAGTRMANDAANGMDFESWSAKYPDGTQEDFDNMSLPFRDAKATSLATTAADAAAVLRRISDAGGDWRSDPSAQAALQGWWEAEDNTGPFDPDWADSRNSEATLTAAQKVVNDTKKEEWFIKLPPAKQTEIMEVLDFMAETATTGGYEYHQNEDGSPFFTDAEGVVVGGEDKSKGQIVKDEETARGWVETAYEDGETITTSRVMEYMQNHAGNEPPSTTELMEWDRTSPSTSNIQEYFSGSGTTVLSNYDRDLLDSAAVAQRAVDAGTATPEQKKLAGSLGVTFANLSFDTNPTSTSGTKTWNPKSAGGGNLQRNVSYSSSIYSKPESNKAASFNPEFLAWAKESQGKTIKVDDVWYTITGIKTAHPIEAKTVGDYTQPFTADALVLQPADGGDVVYETFGTTGHLWD